MEESKENFNRKGQQPLFEQKLLLDSSNFFEKIQSAFYGKDLYISKLEEEIRAYKEENENLRLQNEDQKIKINDLNRKMQELKTNLSLTVAKIKSDYEIVVHQNNELKKVLRDIETKCEKFNSENMSPLQSSMNFPELKRTTPQKFNPLNE